MPSDKQAGIAQPVKVNETWCKGCRICAEFCPKKVFAIVDGKAKVVRPDECIRCGLCQLRCPDFAISLEGEEDE